MRRRDEKWVRPLHHEWSECGEIAQGKLDGIVVGLGMVRKRHHCVRIPGKNTTARNTVEGGFARLPALGIVGRVDDGCASAVSDNLKVVDEVRHIRGRVFIAAAVAPIDRIDDDQVIAALRSYGVGRRPTR